MLYAPLSDKPDGDLLSHATAGLGVCEQQTGDDDRDNEQKKRKPDLSGCREQPDPDILELRSKLLEGLLQV
jgi:hypothetical protein